MNWKALPACIILLGLAGSAWAMPPMTAKEIAMLLRNGEQPQFILEDTAKRKLLQPLSSEEVKALSALGATPAFLAALRAPGMVGTPQAAADYQARVQQQKLTALQQQQESERQEQERRAQQEKARTQLRQHLQQQRADAPGGEYLGKTVDLQFTAADGSSVDLAKLRGKVVLIDFWATWCGPCMREVPKVVAAYQKYHGQGFEIIGISLDKNLDAMLKTAQSSGMSWPQHFDGKGWDNKFSRTFGIRSIPAMWLVNKNGLVVSTDAWGRLDAMLPQLLAE